MPDKRAALADLVEHALLGRLRSAMSSDERSAAPSATASTVSTARPPRRPTLRRGEGDRVPPRHRRSRSGRRRGACADRRGRRSASSCVTTTTVEPCSAGHADQEVEHDGGGGRHRGCRSARRRARAGDRSRARAAIATRCFSPPLSARGRWPSRSARPTATEQLAGAAPGAGGATRAANVNASSTFSSAVSWPSRPKSWNTNPTTSRR